MQNISVNLQLVMAGMNDIDRVKRWLADWLLDWQNTKRLNPLSDRLPVLMSEIGIIEGRLYELENEQE